MYSNRIFIFDLDGTLLNSIGDLGMACNHALQAIGLPTHAIEAYPRMVGNGINKLLERAMEVEKGEREERGSEERKGRESEEERAAKVAALRAHFLPYYNQHCCDLTHPYEGIMDVLRYIREQGGRMAVASNKYDEATQRIVQHYFPQLFDCVMGEREGVPRKPEPQIVDNILRELRYEGERKDIVMIGDSRVDIDTARKAGLRVVACTWGFVGKEQLKEGKPDYMVDSPKELLTLLKQNAI